MAKKKKYTEDSIWLQDLGSNIAKLIKKKGYPSPYDFWVQKLDESVSRSALNYILRGKTDVRISTLRSIARALSVDLSDLLVTEKK